MQHLHAEHDAPLDQSNTDWMRWFDAIQATQEVDSGIQAGSRKAGRIEREAQGATSSGARRTRRPATDVAALEFEKEAVTGIAKPDRSAVEDLEQLRRENAKLKMEIEILKKVAIYFAREAK